jgi:hypothetical protein
MLTTLLKKDFSQPSAGVGFKKDFPETIRVKALTKKRATSSAPPTDLNWRLPFRQQPQKAK